MLALSFIVQSLYNRKVQGLSQALASINLWGWIITVTVKLWYIWWRDFKVFSIGTDVAIDDINSDPPSGMVQTATLSLGLLLLEESTVQPFRRRKESSYKKVNIPFILSGTALAVAMTRWLTKIFSPLLFGTLGSAWLQPSGEAGLHIITPWSS